MLNLESGMRGLLAGSSPLGSDPICGSDVRLRGDSALGGCG